MTQTRENKMSDTIVNSDTRATARYTLVQAILEADNREIILGALTQLGYEYAVTVAVRAEQENKESAVRWAHAANEIGTILACAAYNIEDGK
jgi:hypothetical protein